MLVLLVLANFRKLASALGHVGSGIAHLFSGMDGGVPEDLLYHHEPAIQLLCWGVLGIWLLGLWTIAWNNWANKDDDSS